MKRLLIILLALACLGANECDKIPIPPPDPTPTPAPTVEPTPSPMPTMQPTPEPTATPSPTPLPTPTPDVPVPTPTATPEPEPCVQEQVCTAAGIAGPDGKMLPFPSKQQACDARRDYMERQGHLKKKIVGDKPWYAWGPRGWLNQQCQRYRAPNGRKLSDESYFGIECVQGDPCPEPTPTPAPTPPPTDPSPEPTPPSCAPLTHLKLVGFCAGCCPKCMATGADWGRPPVLRVADSPQNIFLSATYMAGNQEIHSFSPCYPGGLPEDAWSTEIISGDFIDTGDPWSNNHNVTLYSLDFKTKNRYKACGWGVCGSTTVTVR